MMLPVARVLGVYYRLQGVLGVSITQTGVIGAWVRRAVMSKYGDLNDGNATERLSGHDNAGKTRSGHRHAYYLPFDADRDGMLDSLLIYAPEPFALQELEALVAVNRLWGWGNADLRLEVMSFIYEDAAARPLPIVGPSRNWSSATPVFLSRHPKRHRDGRPKLTSVGDLVDGPEEQVRRDWAYHKRLHETTKQVHMPDLVAVGRLDAYRLATGGNLNWSTYEWNGAGSTPPAIKVPFGLTLAFSAEVTGPLAFGYARHAGLGLFMPMLADTF